MSSRLFLSLTFGLGLVAAVPCEAVACSWDYPTPPTPIQLQEAAQAAIDRSTAIIDAEVVRAAEGDRPALVRAVRVLKGPELEVYVIGERDSCWTYEVPAGARMRMLLTGGPDIWFYEETFARAEYEDALLGSVRERSANRD